MTSTLLIVQIVLALAITIAVLLQKSSSIGLGAYSGSNESVFGAKGPTGFLAKLTFTLAFAFIVNTLVLGYLYTTANTSSVADSIIPANNAAVPAVPATAEKGNTAPAAPSAPTVSDSIVPANDAAVPEAPITEESTIPSVPEAAAETTDTSSNAAVPATPKTEESAIPSVPTAN
ncbi:MAG: preprotein translocase subunit SecG [Sulfurovum sp.]|nr:preprotein translocase subunit SecG [Sulfurovum sp.]